MGKCYKEYYKIGTWKNGKYVEGKIKLIKEETRIA